MHLVYVAITGTLLFGASCTLDDELATGDRTEHLGSTGAGNEVSEQVDELSAADLQESPEIDVNDGGKWTCEVRYRSCSHGHADDHLPGLISDPSGGVTGVESDHDADYDLGSLESEQPGLTSGDDDDHCQTDYYYGSHRDKAKARKHALKACHHAHPHDKHRCKVTHCDPP